MKSKEEIEARIIYLNKRITWLIKQGMDSRVISSIEQEVLILKWVLNEEYF